MEIKVFGVKWDTKDAIDDEDVTLEKDIEITVDETTMDDENDIDELEDLISDTLSDTIGFCHYGWESYECLNGKVFTRNDDNDIKTFKVRAFFFDVDEDPTTPFKEEDYEVEAEDEVEALAIGRGKAYDSQYSVGNVSVDVEIW